MKTIGMLAFAALAGWSQQLDLSSLDKLESRAQERSVVDLDGDKLRLGAGLLAGEGAPKEVMAGMKGVFVRTYEFAKAGEFTQADLDGIRNQLKNPKWSRLVDVREKDESTEVWFYNDNGKMGGMAVLAAEAKELTVVNLVGSLDLASLARLSGTLGIPNIQSNLGGSGGKKPATSKGGTKDDDEE